MLWSTAYETGVPLIDEHHREVFRRLGALGDSSAADHVSQLLVFVGNSVERHFRDEDRLHVSSAYPQRLKHKKLHRDFLEDYKRLVDEYSRYSGQQGLMALRINRITVDWLRKHITGPDRSFAEFYYGKKGKVPPVGANSTWQAETYYPAQPADSSLSLRTLMTASPMGSRASTPGEQSRPEDMAVLRRVSAQALADELVRRSRVARRGLPRTL